MQCDRRTMREGLLVGLIAYAAVAVFYVVFDVLAARGALFTLDMLGQTVFRGLRDPAVLMFSHQLDPAAMLEYNALHLVVSLVLGALVAGVVARAERQPAEAPALMLAVLVGGAIAVLVVGVLTDAMRPVLPWWSIVVANALAAVLAGAYLVGRHPALRPGIAVAA